MLLTLSPVVSSLSPTTSGELLPSYTPMNEYLHYYRLLDKIAKDILVCENKTVRKWDGSIGAYKNYLRKKMLQAGAV